MRLCRLRPADEALVVPERPRCDPHRPLPDWANNRDRSGGVAAVLESGHNLASRVSIECGTERCPNAAEGLRPVAETEGMVRRAQRPLATLGRTTCIEVGVVSSVNLSLAAQRARCCCPHPGGAGRFGGLRHCMAKELDARVPWTKCGATTIACAMRAIAPRCATARPGRVPIFSTTRRGSTVSMPRLEIDSRALNGQRMTVSARLK